MCVTFYLHGVQLLLFGVQLFLSFSEFRLSDHQTSLLQGQVGLHTHTRTHTKNESLCNGQLISKISNHEF